MSGIKKSVLIALFFPLFLTLAGEPTVSLFEAASYPNAITVTEPGIQIKKNESHTLIRHKNARSLVLKNFKKVILKDQENLSIFHESYVTFHLYPDDAKRLHDLTKNNIGKQIACYIGKKFFCAPVVCEPIATGVFQITGKFDENDLKLIRQLIRTSGDSCQ